ncbi:hypothetical protein [Microbacterium sp. 179-I 3D4 NHS]|uniref:hypothetical protein n=1 Tax=Microbacterium sp. 179-I 3D4 NHS TaxID=3142381 RepID=UPI0039A3A40C
MPNRYGDELSMLQEIHLSQESDSAKHLIAYGVHALRTAAFIETTRDPIMTMLSIGVEKTLKLSLGLRNVEDTGTWLPARILKNEYRHDLIKMEQLLREVIRANLEHATHRSFVDEALAAVDADPVWPHLVAALNRYGQEGRFYNLDALADNPQREESPSTYWDVAERAALDDDDDLHALFQQMLEDFSLSAEFYKRLNVRMADSLRRFRDLVGLAAVQGVLGERAKAWGHEFNTIGRQITDA